MRIIKKSFVVSLILFVIILLPMNVQAAGRFKLSADRLTTYVGASVKLKVTGAKGTVKWTSSNNSIATVSDSGKITAVKSGKTIIKAHNNGVTLKCPVTVKKLLTAKQAVNKYKKDSKIIRYTTINMYLDKINDSKFLGCMAVDRERKIAYVDLAGLGINKRYITNNRVYWYNKGDSKWYYYKNKGEVTVSQNEISNISSPVSKGIRNFNGRKAMQVKAVVDKKTVMLYFDISDFTLIGMTEKVNKHRAVIILDYKSKVAIPSDITKKAKYREELKTLR